MSTIQYGWHRSQFVTPKPNEIVWVMDDEKEVRLVVYEALCIDGTPWRVFGETTRLYGFRWWQRCADNMNPPPEPPKDEVPMSEAVKAFLDAENAKYPGITHGLDGKPITCAAPQEGVYGPEGCQGDPDENPDRVNAPEPLGEPANIRTELAQLRADLMAVCKFLHDPDGLSIVTTMEKMNSALKVVSKHVLALDSNQKQMNVRLAKIEKHTDFSDNSK